MFIIKYWNEGKGKSVANYRQSLRYWIKIIFYLLHGRYCSSREPLLSRNCNYLATFLGYPFFTDQTSWKLACVWFVAVISNHFGKMISSRSNTWEWLLPVWPSMCTMYAVTVTEPSKPPRINDLNRRRTKTTYLFIPVNHRI